MIKFIVGITGGSGTGKTTLIKHLSKEFKGKIATFSLDNYYLPIEEQKKDVNGIPNFDLPTALDTAKIEQDINALIAGKAIKQAVYGFNNPDNKPTINTVEPKELLIIEGLYVLYYDFLRRILDYSVYLSVDEDLQLERRIKRDVDERNYKEEDILYQWHNHVMPSYKEHILPFKDSADLIIIKNEGFGEDINILMETIHQKLDND